MSEVLRVVPYPVTLVDAHERIDRLTGELNRAVGERDEARRQAEINWGDQHSLMEELKDEVKDLKRSLHTEEHSAGYWRECAVSSSKKVEALAAKVAEQSKDLNRPEVLITSLKSTISYWLRVATQHRHARIAATDKVRDLEANLSVTEERYEYWKAIAIGRQEDARKAKALEAKVAEQSKTLQQQRGTIDMLREANVEAEKDKAAAIERLDRQANTIRNQREESGRLRARNNNQFKRLQELTQDGAEISLPKEPVVMAEEGFEHLQQCFPHRSPTVRDIWTKTF